MGKIMESNGNTKLARALYTNTPEAKNELFFRKGDILTVTQFDYEGQNGWWLCTLLGESGICPGNYLELLEHDYQNMGEDANIPCYDVPKSYKRPPTPPKELNPLDLYDVPKGHPIYNSASVVRAKKHGSNGSLLSSGSSNRASTASSFSSSALSSTSSEENSFAKLNEQILKFRKSPSPRPESPIYANEQSFPASTTSRPTRKTPSPARKSSVQQPDELDYDVPRSALLASRRSPPPNSLSGSRSCVHSSSSHSKDMYDVPRSVKNCVSLFENKYDHVQHRPPSTTSSSPHHRRDAVKRSSICSSVSSSNDSSSTNPNSSIEKHFGVILRNAGALRNADSISSSSDSKVESVCDEAYDIPPSSRTGSVRSWSAKNASSNISIDQGFAYDRPAQFSRQASVCGSTDTLYCHENFRKRETPSFSSSNLSIATATGYSRQPAEVKFLPLCPKSAVTICEKLRQEVITSINAVLNLVKPNWRVKENLTEVMPELRFGCVRLNLGVKDYTEFCSRAVSNAKKFGLETLLTRLHKLLAALTNGSQIVQKDVDELEAYLWSVDRLSVPTNGKEAPADALDQLVLCARSLQYDVTEIANFIAINSTALFQDVVENSSVTSKLTTSTLQPESVVEDTQEDYDYVTLSSTEEVQTASQTISAKSSSLNSRDQQILDFYSAQISLTAPLLSQSISTFISSVHQNDPPKVFNAHLKYVILLAYKMLFAGDTIHRNLSHAEVKEDIEKKADELHKAVVALHEASKVATRDFPKLLPMQNIIEHVWQTTSAAAELKKIIFNATL